MQTGTFRSVGFMGNMSLAFDACGLRGFSCRRDVYGLMLRPHPVVQLALLTTTSESLCLRLCMNAYTGTIQRTHEQDLSDLSQP